MNNHDNILNELMEVSPAVANVGRHNVYSVPYKYFDSLAKSIIEKIASKEKDTFDFSTSNPFTLPENYFDNLPSHILGKIAEQATVNEIKEELNGIAPILNTIDRRNVYTVPDTYFQHLKYNTSSFASTKQTGKVISVNNLRRFTKYAVAAVITGIIVISGLVMLHFLFG